VTSWAGYAFGLSLQGEFPLSGCDGGAPSASAERSVRIERSDRDTLEGLMPSDAEVIAWLPAGPGRPRQRDVIEHPDAGYLIDCGEVGLFHVSAAGDLIRCSQGDVEPWRWERHLMGRALPFASTLAGLEPWHAGAVAVASGTRSGDAGSIVLAGESGRGKSTLVAELLLAGATLVADDVLALEPTPEGVLGHPGPGLISLRRPSLERLTERERGRVGTPVGGDSESTRFAVRRHDRPLSIEAVFLLEGAAPGAAGELELITAPDPRSLLASTFNFVLSGPQRLLTQLDVCSALARTVPIWRVTMSPHVRHRDLAERILAEVGR
jgi:hypothetical protein